MMAALRILSGLVSVTMMSSVVVDAVDITPFPTLPPTTLKPTASPTIPSDLCNEADKEKWEQTDKEIFDETFQLCTAFCAGGQLNQNIDFGDITDPKECFMNCTSTAEEDRLPELVISPVSPGCAVCWGDYAQCMFTRCICPLGRISTSCTKCSLERCEADFEECSGGLRLKPLELVKELDSQQQILLLGGSVGAAVLFLGAGYFVYLKSARKANNQLLELDTNTGGASTLMNPVAAQEKMQKAAAKYNIKIETAVPANSPASSYGNRRAPPPVPGNKPGSGGAGGKVMLIADKPFPGKREGELAIKKGIQLEGIREVNKNWWSVRNPETGETGLVPAKAVRRM